MKLSLVESRLFGRICYGFEREKYGMVSVNEEKSGVVKTIYEMYLSGMSLEMIQKYLHSGTDVELFCHVLCWRCNRLSVSLLAFTE